MTKRKYVKSQVTDIDMFGFETKETAKEKKQRLRLEKSKISFTDEEFFNAHHIVSFSGGKDSTALLLTAIEYKKQGKIKDFEVVFCDTGNESLHTYSFIRYLKKKLQIKITAIETDFYPYKQLLLASEKSILREYGAMFKSTGNAFFNMLLYVKCFPHGQSARFCTGILK